MHSHQTSAQSPSYWRRRGVAVKRCPWSRRSEPEYRNLRSQGALNSAFKWVNTTLGNIKSAIAGTYRAIRDKHVPRYLAEFEYRFNRRYDLAAMMPRLGYVAVRTPPMPYRLLKLAEDHA